MSRVTVWRVAIFFAALAAIWVAIGAPISEY